MNYTLNQLQIFLNVVQSRSITRAAANLHLTQPAVSIQLKKFQDQFDIPLIEVISKKIYITDFGNEIAEAANRILGEIEAIDIKLLAHQGQLTGKIRISVVSTGKYVAPYIFADFMKKNPGVDLVMDVTNKAQVIESLEKNEIDFALVSMLPENLHLEKVQLMQNKLFVVGNFDRELPKKEYTHKIFENVPLIYREQGSGTRHFMEKYIRKNRLPISKKMELTSNEAVKQAVIAGLGYSIMPLIGIKNELNNRQLRIIPVAGFPILTTWNLIWLKGKKFSPAASAYLSFLKKEKQRIIRENFEWFEAF